jgi:hypothetical protein
VPTTGATKDMAGALTVRRTGLVVRPEVRFSGARFRAIGVSIPTDGTCLSRPCDVR